MRKFWNIKFRKNKSRREYFEAISFYLNDSSDFDGFIRNIGEYEITLFRLNQQSFEVLQAYSKSLGVELPKKRSENTESLRVLTQILYNEKELSNVPYLCFTYGKRIACAKSSKEALLIRDSSITANDLKMGSIERLDLGLKQCILNEFKEQDFKGVDVELLSIEGEWKSHEDKIYRLIPSITLPKLKMSPSWQRRGHTLLKWSR